jgi:hypothetical protein
MGLIYFRTRNSVRRWQLEKLREELCPPWYSNMWPCALAEQRWPADFATCWRLAACATFCWSLPISRFGVDWLFIFLPFCRDVLKLHCTAKVAATGPKDGEKTARRDRRWHLQGRRLQCSVHDCRMALPTGPEVSRLGAIRKAKNVLLSR